MIIRCPKCGSTFNVDDTLLKNQKMKFQCCDCDFVWDEDINLPDTTVSDAYRKEEHNFPSCLSDKSDVDVESIAENKYSVNVNNASFYNLKYLFFVGLTFVFICIAYLLYEFTSFKSSFKSGSKVSGNLVKNEVSSKGLYIELITPLKLIKEGENSYVMVKGFILNTSKTQLDIPRLVVKLQNKEGRILQEQEREVDVNVLAPGAKVEFLFKVFKFSSQVSTVMVDFVDVNKI